MSHCTKKWITANEILENRPRLVHRSVVDDDDFVPVRSIRKCLRRLLHEQRKIFRFVLCGDENAHGWTRSLRKLPGRSQRASHGSSLRRGGRHMRLRILAERTPSWSRYFATVRRAICTPLSRRMLTIAWSVSGCLGSSSCTSFSSWALMPRAETSSPSVVASPEEKKNLSGSTPRGVWTNFSLVTRLTVDSCMLMTSATSRSVRGFRYCTPFSKNSRCRSTI